MKNSGIMEYWNDGIVGRILLFFVALNSAICNLHSAIESGGDLMLWIMDGPEKGII
jgi:hypothetical protein